MIPVQPHGRRVDSTGVDPRRARRGRARSFGWAFAAHCLAAIAAAQEPLPVLTHSQEIYGVDAAGRGQHRHFEIDAVVSYYDPLWTQFYGIDGTTTFYLGTNAAGRFAIKPGQQVHLSGEVVTDGRFVPTQLDIQVIPGSETKHPINAHGHLGEFSALNARLIGIDALVDWQEQFDSGHQRLSLIAEGRRLNTTVCLNEAGRAPLLEGAVVHAVGMYLPHLDINNRLVNVELKVQGPENLQLLHWLGRDERFDGAAVPASDVARLGAGTPVHVSGKINSFAPGRLITIRDSSGLLELYTPQEKGLHLGAEIEAVGFRTGDPALPGVEQAVWRMRDAAAATAKSPDRSTLRLAAQVLETSFEQAAAQQPVVLSGVATWSSEDGGTFFLQDPSGGIRVTMEPGGKFAGYVGGLGVTVSGVTSMGQYAPEVTAHAITVAATMSPPEAPQISLEQALTGAEQNRWVEMKGYVHAFEAKGPWVQLDLITSTGEFQALLRKTVDVAGLQGSFVRIRGVCDTITNELHHTAGIQLWVPAEEHVFVDEPPLRDPLALPLTPLDSIGSFGHVQDRTHWLHTVGTVTYLAPGRFTVIQTGRTCLVALTRENLALGVGDDVDVVGIPGWSASHFVLREATVRRSGHEAEPAAIQLGTPVPLLAAIDFRLVQLGGQLSEITDVDGEYYLSLRNGADTIIARLRHRPNAPAPEEWAKGSYILATGIYRLQLDENRDATRVELLLRSPEDLKVTRTPPWWTVGRALTVASMLGALAAAIAMWVVSLRHRVAKQTAELRRHLESEASLEAELQRSQRLHSLGMLAGGIAHDFNNLLTVIQGNIALAMLDEVAMTQVGDCLQDAEEGAKRAQELSQRLLTFSRGGDPVCEDLIAAAVVLAAASLGVAGSETKVDFHPPADLWRVRGDPNQLRRAFQNLVAFGRGAMAEGGSITIAAANDELAARTASGLAPGRYVRFTLTDRGRGIPEGLRRGIFDPYASAELGKEQFGLAIAYSIVKKHGGSISFTCPPTGGTCFELWIPAVESPCENPAKPAPLAAGLPRKILFMDDEASIRRMGKRVLESLQCEVTTVADGQDCVRSFRNAHQSGQPYDFVILDLSIPGGMGGAEAIGRLREIDPGVRAIVSSGYSNDTVVANFQNFGFCAFLPKPYDTRTLARVIEQAVTPGS